MGIFDNVEGAFHQLPANVQVRMMFVRFLYQRFSRSQTQTDPRYYGVSPWQSVFALVRANTHGVRAPDPPALAAWRQAMYDASLGHDIALLEPHLIDLAKLSQQRVSDVDTSYQNFLTALANPDAVATMGVRDAAGLQCFERAEFTQRQVFLNKDNSLLYGIIHGIKHLSTNSNSVKFATWLSERSQGRN